MALAVLKHLGASGSDEVFEIEIGENRFYRFLVGTEPHEDAQWGESLSDVAWEGPIEGPVAEAAEAVRRCGCLAGFSIGRTGSFSLPQPVSETGPDRRSRTCARCGRARPRAPERIGAVAISSCRPRLGTSRMPAVMRKTESARQGREGSPIRRELL